jgi:hypothetical protein
MPGPNTAAVPEPLITTVRISDGEITAVLTDGRTITVPLAWSWRLSEANARAARQFPLDRGR